MPRPKRICIPSFPHHVVQRGNNRQATFYHRDDFRAYREFLCDAATTHSVSIHAYVLMTNHVHLLLSPSASDGLSMFMQALGRRYVTYINKTYCRTGTLWEGRFKSSVIESDAYCITCYRYIDLNPVRAGIALQPAAYPWSSYRANALGEANHLLTPHATYLQLGSTLKDRVARYRNLVDDALDDNAIDRIRYGARKELPVGTDHFKNNIEKYIRRRLGTGELGRPRK